MRPSANRGQPLAVGHPHSANGEQHPVLNTPSLVLATPPSALGPRYSRLDIVALSIIALLVAAVAATMAFASVTKPGSRVAFLAPAYGAVHNIWIVDPANPSAAQQATFSPDGVFNFDVSPDGRYIAFAERNNSTATTEIKLLDLHTGALQQLTYCIAADADCKTPTWRPDGKVIAYERMELNSSLSNAGVSPIRVWLLDLTTDPITTRPLFNDSQILGYSPQWSGDGSRIAVFDNASGGVLVYDFLDGSVKSIPSRYGTVGTLSPDGARLVFPEMTRRGNQMYAHLKIANLVERQFGNLTQPDEPVDDIMPAWHPDGTRLAIARQYLDDRWTRGHQVYLLNPEDGTVEPLVVDERYNSSFFTWNPDGSQLLIQRFPELTENGELNDQGRPEVWTYDMKTRKLTQIAVDAFQPRWVPSSS